MASDDEEEYTPRRRAHQQGVPARKNQPRQRIQVRGIMAAFVSKRSRMSRDGVHVLRKTGPRLGTAYNLQTAGAKEGLKRAATEVNTGPAVEGKRQRKPPSQCCAFAKNLTCCLQRLSMLVLPNASRRVVPRQTRATLRPKRRAMLQQHQSRCWRVVGVGFTVGFLGSRTNHHPYQQCQSRAQEIVPTDAPC